MKEKIKEIAKKWAFHLRESAISEESVIEEAITEALNEAKVFSSNAVLSNSVCTCTISRETPMINGKHICSICNKPIVQTV